MADLKQALSLLLTVGWKRHTSQGTHCSFCLCDQNEDEQIHEGWCPWPEVQTYLDGKKVEAWSPPDE